MSDIKSKEIQLVDLNSIIPNPKNANRHSIEQIKRLEELIKYQGFRNPVIISNRTGFMVAGHGRLIAAKNLGMTQVPAIYQDFDSEAQEYTYLISDNEIARWAELDKQSLYDTLGEIEIPSLDLLGIEDFNIDDLDLGEKEDVEGELDFTKELDEKNDYIVLLFNSKESFAKAKEHFGIQSVSIDLSESGKNENMIISGTGRVIDGDIALGF